MWGSPWRLRRAGRPSTRSRPGGWRDYVTLLHLPYTAWHLSYVAIGAALSAAFAWDRFLPTLAAFFLAVGIGAHALDELNGRPLATRIPGGVLAALGAVSIAGAVVIGIVGALTIDPWIGAFVAAGGVHRGRLQPGARSAAASTETSGSAWPGARFRS